jgi:tetratricopeptide (TPR) repeat protein
MADQSQSDNGSARSQPQDLVPADQTIDQVPERADGDDGLQPAAGDSGPPLPAQGSVLQALAASLPSVPRIRLQDPDEEPPTPINRPSSEQKPGTAELPERYQLVGEIARGGMGAVFKGRDTDLGRDIAVKILLEGHAGRTELLQRFVEEAQIGGQLQHPGVVPIYELGQAGDRRPYFTMKLVKGQTLAALLKQRANLQHDLPRFLGIFGQVCQTLAYAHAHGVIHRDLKPSNIMVGAFGEVQVMDWGLAKVLASRERERPEEERPEEATVIQTIRSNAPAGSASGTDTRAGSVLGTPAYMAPEQARGEADSLDERVDVFGLGGLLCVILTGQPPFRGPTGAEQQHQAAGGKLADAFARLDNCGADLELITLARRCLAPRKEDRPRQAGAVAEAVQSYQERVQQRLRTAELEREKAQVQAEEERKRRQVERARAQEERKRRWVQLYLAAAMVALVLGGSGAGLWYQQYRAEASSRQERAELAVAEALRKARGIHTDLHMRLSKPGGVFVLLNQPADWEKQIALARGALQQALDLAAGAEAPVAEELQRELRTLKDLLAQDQRNEKLARRLETIREQRSILVEGKFTDAPAAREYPRPFQQAGFTLQPGQEQQAAEQVRQSPIKEQLVASLDDWAFVAWRQQDKRLHQRLLQIARRADPDPWKDQVRSPGTWRNRAALKALAGQGLADRQLLKRLSPQLLSLVGVLLRGADAEDWLRQAQLLHPGDFWLNFHLAWVLIKDKPVEATGFYRAALGIRPASTASWNNLGIALYAQKKLPEAITAFKKAIDLDPKAALPWNNLGSTLCDQNKLPEAIAAYHKAIDLEPRLAYPWSGLGRALSGQKKLPEAIAAFKKAIDLDPKAALPWSGLGSALLDQKKLPEAIAAYHKAIELEPEYAMAWNNLGLALRDQKQLPEAVAAFKKAVDFEPKLVLHWYNLGNTLRDQKQLPEAIAAYQKAIDLEPEYAMAWNNLGLALRDQNKLTEAIAAYKNAADLEPKAAYPWNNLGSALYDQKQLPEAIAAFKKAIDLEPKAALPWSGLANSLHAQKQLPEAIAAYKMAIDRDPKLAHVWYNLGNALSDQKQLPAATVAFKKAIDLEPTLAKPWYGLGNALRDQNKLSEAIAAYHKAIDLEPEYAMAWNNLGIALRDQNKLSESIAAFKKAIDFEPKSALHLYNLGNTLRHQKQLPEAIAAFKKAIDLEPEYAMAWNNLGIALRDHNKLSESIAAFKKAVDLDPKAAYPWNNLGSTLYDQNKLPEAIAAYKKAIDLEPKLAYPWFGLGNALSGQKKPLEAIAAFKKAIDLEPNYAQAHGALGRVLLQQGQFAEARHASLNCLKLLPPNEPQHNFGQQQLQQCERLLLLDQRRAAILAGQAQTKDAAELLDLGDLCRQYKRQYALAARFYGNAFTAEPKWAERRRYAAACCAALAGTAQGDDTASLPDQKRAKLRQQAMDWLQAELGSLRRRVTTSPARQPVSPLEKLAGSGNGAPAVEVFRALDQLTHWQQDPDLASVRDDKELGRLTGEEQKAWRALWADVAALHKQARALFRETQHRGQLTDQQRDKVHEVSLQAGKTYVFDLESKDFDAFLRLEDKTGQKLAENDDIEPGVNQNSRIVFTAPKDGTYRLVASSFENRGMGAYTLIIREFTGSKK